MVPILRISGPNLRLFQFSDLLFIKFLGLSYQGNFTEVINQTQESLIVQEYTLNQCYLLTNILRAYLGKIIICGSDSDKEYKKKYF